MKNKPVLSWQKRCYLNIFRLYRASQASLHDLRYLFWECTLRCNLSCIHCGSDCLAKSDYNDMPLNDFLKVLDEIAQKYNPNKITIALTGGEPLLRDDLEECGVQFIKRGYPWGMVTNGYSMTEERFRSLRAAGLCSLTVSLDGLEDSHNWLRNNKDSFKHALHTIELCVKEKGLIYDVVTCITQKNFKELGEIKRLLCDIGVVKWRIFNIFPKGRAKGNELLDISPNQLRDLMEFIKECRGTKSIEVSYSCEGFLGEYEGVVRDGFFWCRAGVDIGSVLIDGSISACPSLRADYIQGNIYRDSFLDVWENRFNIMRNRKWTKNGLCGKCRVYKWCNGSGLHLRDEKSSALLRCHYLMLESAKVEK